MDEQQVHIIETERRKRAVDAALRLPVAVCMRTVRGIATSFLYRWLFRIMDNGFILT